MWPPRLRLLCICLAFPKVVFVLILYCTLSLDSTISIIDQHFYILLSKSFAPSSHTLVRLGFLFVGCLCVIQNNITIFISIAFSPQWIAITLSPFNQVIEYFHTGKTGVNLQKHQLAQSNFVVPHSIISIVSKLEHYCLKRFMFV